LSTPPALPNGEKANGLLAFWHGCKDPSTKTAGWKEILAPGSVEGCAAQGEKERKARGVANVYQGLHGAGPRPRGSGSGF
jgi:hypothetical protein